MPATTMSFPLTLTAILARAERWFPAVELVERGRRSNYAELGRRARQLAAALLAAGLKPGDRVATLLWNQLPHLEAYFGVPLAGGIVHPLNLRLHPTQLARIVNHAGDRFVIVDASLAPLWSQIAPAVAVETVVHCPDDYEVLLASAPQAVFPTLAEKDPAAMGYTSGTTGEPKGVTYSHRAIALHALAIALPDALDYRQRDCVLPLVAMFHASAWGAPYAAAMIGCKQVLAGSLFDPESVLDLLAAEQVTRSAGVPVIWQSVLDALDRHPGRWRLHPELRVNLGGAPAPAALFRRFDQHGIAVNMGWGMTEMTPVGTMNPLLAPDGLPNFDQRRTFQGRPLPFVEARTAPRSAGLGLEGPQAGASTSGKHGAAAQGPAPIMGELEVRGPWVAGAYVGGASPESFTPDGWFRTGDVVQFNPQGLMQIVDRDKDLIRSGGEWISSVALENALACHPDVREAAVIAVPHPKWQERPRAYLVLREGAAADPAAWRRHLEAEFPAWQCPDDFVVTASLPRTSTGKLDKRQLRATYAPQKA